jgi:hypothetical protein
MLKECSADQCLMELSPRNKLHSAKRSIQRATHGHDVNMRQMNIDFARTVHATYSTPVDNRKIEPHREPTIDAAFGRSSIN